MEIERTISSKGQIVVPRDIRKSLGLKPGSEIVFEVLDGTIIIRVKRDPKSFVDDFLETPNKIKKINIKKIKEILDEAYEIH